MLVLFALSGCSFFDKAEKKEAAAQLYRLGKGSLQQNSHASAIEYFERLESTYPFNPYAQKVSLILAYLYYNNYEYEKSQALLNQFIRLNPNHEHLDYAYYLKGIVNYNFGEGFLSAVLERDRTNKDPGPMIEAFNMFKILVENYPDSRYTQDARLRIIALRNILAVYEIRIADYYMRRSAYAAVVNRIEYLIEHYQGAQYMPQGLDLLAKAYQKLNMHALSESTLRVINLNYPDYYQKEIIGIISEEDEESWFSKLKDLTSRTGSMLNLSPRY